LCFYFILEVYYTWCSLLFFILCFLNNWFPNSFKITFWNPTNTDNPRKNILGFLHTCTSVGWKLTFHNGMLGSYIMWTLFSFLQTNYCPKVVSSSFSTWMICKFSNRLENSWIVTPCESKWNGRWWIVFHCVILRILSWRYISLPMLSPYWSCY